jgi:hypothetical protein
MWVMVGRKHHSRHQAAGTLRAGRLDLEELSFTRSISLCSESPGTHLDEPTLLVRGRVTKHRNLPWLTWEGRGVGGTGSGSHFHRQVEGC